MMQPATVGVLSSWVGLAYLGGILTGIHDVLRPHGIRVAVVRTRIQTPHGLSAPLEHPPASARLAGWIDIAGAVPDATLRALARSGKPLVTVSHYVPGLACPTVLTDNQGGTAALVEHLIEHGHRRIAFIGNLDDFDQHERFKGYQARLAAHNIPVDPALFFPVQGYATEDEQRGIQQLIDGGVPCSAVIADTDRLALLLIEALSAAGYSVPEDVVVVGFDDVDQAQYAVPPLTTVRQKPYELGRKAAELMLAQLEGAELADGPFYVPTALIRRRSCGCDVLSELSLGASASQGQRRRWQDDLMRRLAALVVYPLRLEADVEPTTIWPGVAQIVQAVEAALYGTSMPEELNQVWDRALGLTTNLEILHELLALIEREAREQLATLQDQAAAQLRLEACLQRLYLEMTRARLTLETQTNRIYLDEIIANSEIGVALMAARDSRPQEMAWARLTGLRWACMGKWTQGGARRELTIVGAFSKEGRTPQLAGRSASWDDFLPCADLAAAGAGRESDISFLLPFETTTDVGGIAVFMETLDARFISRHGALHRWMEFLCAAVDREELIVALDRKHQELEVAKEAAETANELKTKFLSNMSHELRTPLNSVINFAHFLGDAEISDAPLSAQQSMFQQRILSNGEHLLGLINDILDLSKIEAGKMELYPEALDLAPLLQGVMSTAIGLTKDKGLALSLELPCELPRVWADKTRVRQVMLNLLSNAAKFTERGGITVSVAALGRGLTEALVMRDLNHRGTEHTESIKNIGGACRSCVAVGGGYQPGSPAWGQELQNGPSAVAELEHPADDDGADGPGFLLIAVRDSGMGIAPEHLALVFEEFQQVQSAGGQHYQGTGLGLPISRRFIELHGGQMWAESTPGQGSTFCFTLPLIRS